MQKEFHKRPFLNEIIKMTIERETFHQNVNLKVDYLKNIFYYN